MKDKALIKSTGEILEVGGHYIVKNYTATFDLEDIWESNNVDFSEFGEFDKVELKHESDNKREGMYYKLSDGKEYIDDELVIGLVKIREYKLNKIL